MSHASTPIAAYFASFAVCLLIFIWLGSPVSAQPLSEIDSDSSVRQSAQVPAPTSEEPENPTQQDGPVPLQQDGTDQPPAISAQPTPAVLNLTVRAGDVEINAENFPDPVFRNYVLNNLDPDHNGVLTQAECDAVTTINVANQSPKIQSLQGIGFFPNLKVLRCDSNDLTSLDLSQNPALTNLVCNNNQISNLNLSSNSQLEVLECYGNPLSSIDLSNKPVLRQLSCGGPQLSNLDLSGAPNLLYLNILGGPLKTLNLSVTPKLESLISAGTELSSIDLSNNPELQYISLTGNKLTTLDVSHNTKLQSLDVEQNQMISIHMGNVSVPNPVVKDQYPLKILLGAGQSSYNLTNLDPNIDPSAISDLKNATLNGTTLEGIQLGTPVTYNYTSNGVTIAATLDFVEENAWTVPLHIDGWTYGESPNQPEAEAREGTVHYLYGKDGNFSTTVPTDAGNWVVKAIVDPTQSYAGLEDEVPFVISKAVPQYTTPTGLTAVYGDTLRDVQLPSGFSWKDPGTSVGNAGSHSFDAIYTPQDTANYLSVDPVPIQIQVLPKNGEGFEVSPVNNQQDVEHLTVRDGTTTLIPGVDYIVTETPGAGSVLVTIQFIGNYTGTIYRSYPVGGGSGSSGSVPQTGDTSGVVLWSVLLGVSGGGALGLYALCKALRKGKQPPHNSQ